MGRSCPLSSRRHRCLLRRWLCHSGFPWTEEGAGGFGGEEASGGKGFNGFLIQMLRVVFHGLRNVSYLPSGRDAGGGDFRVTEDEFAVDERG